MITIVWKLLTESRNGILSFLSNFLVFSSSLLGLYTVNFTRLAQMVIYQVNNLVLVVFCTFGITLTAKRHEMTHLPQLPLVRRSKILYASRHRKVLIIREKMPDAKWVVVRDVKLVTTKMVLLFITKLRITVRLVSRFVIQNV